MTTWDWRNSKRTRPENKMFGRLTLPQMIFAGVLGVGGGIYIYQPIFEQYTRDQRALKEKSPTAQEPEDKKS
ncbi:protein PIGBOS1 isoform X1 [Tachyglossus aculeatus]|uniref:protein PIGBOS1 isoform X1 n=2 Tax=Tachyglossus aculeatus TaxID=9261 RepID=UPI0018F49B40|nr:protein PIGBOS1 isoform X1 [Tachyglossus aculeatus]